MNKRIGILVKKSIYMDVEHARKLMEAMDNLPSKTIRYQKRYPIGNFYVAELENGNFQVLSPDDKRISTEGSFATIVRYCRDHDILPSSETDTPKKEGIMESFIQGLKLSKLPEYGDFSEKDTHFTDNRRVDSFAELQDILAELSHKPWIIFRGINQAKFKQFTSSQRHWLTDLKIRKSFSALDDKKYHKDNYRDFIQHVLDRCHNSEELRRINSRFANPDNELFLLAETQHYVVFSPLLDFSTNPNSSLFFAFDGADEAISSRENNINDYVSLYYIDDFEIVNHSYNRLNAQGLVDADEKLKQEDEITGKIPHYSDALKKMYDTPFSDIYDNGITYIQVNKGELGVAEQFLKVISGNTQSEINSARLQAQDGLFMLNTSSSMPLEDVLIGGQGFRPYKMGCINIRKTLKKDVERFLLAESINKQSQYDVGDYKDIERILYSVFPELSPSSSLFKKIKDCIKRIFE